MKTGPGFAVLYRWRLRPGMEPQFVQAWSEVSRLLLEQRGSLGSRLHRGEDGIWYSYVQWPSAQVREASASLPSVSSEARAAMRACIAEELPNILLESVADFMLPVPPKEPLSPP